MKFAEHSGLNLFATNEEVLKMWDEQDLFHRSMTEREGCPSFVFFEGPPSANGHPGIHHVMARTIKDVFCRYKTMQGFQVNRKAGWDTHGLPVELGVEKELGITKEDIGRSISIEEYNARCRRNVMMYTQEWTDLSAPACNGDIIRYGDVLLHSLPSGDSRRDVRVYVSEDEGKTWSYNKLIVPYWSAYSSLCVLPDNTIGLYVEEAYEEDEGYEMVFYRFSFDYLSLF